MNVKFEDINIENDIKFNSIFKTFIQEISKIFKQTVQNISKLL